MDDTLYDHDLDASPATVDSFVPIEPTKPKAPALVKGKVTQDQPQGIFAEWVSGLSIPDLIGTGLALGVAIVAPPMIAIERSVPGLLLYLAVILSVPLSLCLKRQWRRVIPRWHRFKPRWRRLRNRLGLAGLRLSNAFGDRNPPRAPFANPIDRRRRSLAIAAGVAIVPVIIIGSFSLDRASNAWAEERHMRRELEEVSTRRERVASGFRRQIADLRRRNLSNLQKRYEQAAAEAWAGDTIDIQRRRAEIASRFPAK